MEHVDRKQISFCFSKLIRYSAGIKIEKNYFIEIGRWMQGTKMKNAFCIRLQKRKRNPLLMLLFIWEKVENVSFPGFKASIPREDKWK